MFSELQARLRLSDVVERDDVSEAMRLIEMSKDTLNHDLDGENTRPMLSVDKIRELIRGIATANESRDVSMDDAMERCASRGFSVDEIEDAIAECEELNLLQVSRDKKTITFV